jgi:shikimate 5-dehydrogenase
MPTDMEEIKQCFKEIQKSTKTMNHSSERMAGAMETLQVLMAKNDVRNIEILNELKTANNSWHNANKDWISLVQDITKKDVKIKEGLFKFLKWFISLASLALFGAKIAGII